MNLKVLWTIAGSMGTVSDIELLRKIKWFNIEVLAADNADKDAAGFLATGRQHVLPKAKDPDYVNALIEICKKEKVTTIIPQYSDELLPMCKNLHRFKELGVEVLVTEDPKKLQIANSKAELYEFFRGENFIPAYTLVSTIDALEASVLSLGYPAVPVCIKPAKGEGGKGFRIITEEKVDIFNEAAGSPKVNLEAYLNQLKTMNSLPELMVSEYLPGKEYSVDCVCKEGETFICIPRQRIQTSMGVASVSLIENNKELIRLSKDIISALKLSYNINIQFKYSSDEKPKLIEINPRVSGSLVANDGAGVNMLEAALRIAYDMPLEDLNIKWGTKMVRYWSQLFTQV